jgi:hypothetical protein
MKLASSNIRQTVKLSPSFAIPALPRNKTKKLATIASRSHTYDLLQFFCVFL